MKTLPWKLFVKNLENPWEKHQFRIFHRKNFYMVIWKPWKSLEKSTFLTSYHETYLQHRYVAHRDMEERTLKTLGKINLFLHTTHWLRVRGSLNLWILHGFLISLIKPSKNNDSGVLIWSIKGEHVITSHSLVLGSSWDGHSSLRAYYGQPYKSLGKPTFSSVSW